MRKCACGADITHIVFLQHVHEHEILDAHRVRRDTGFLCSQHLLAFICLFDQNRPPTAELERHYLQHGRDHQHTHVHVYILCMRQRMPIHAL